MEKILISACLLGLPVRYDGKSKALLHQILPIWRQQGRLVAVCPEVAGGLAVPREPAEYQPDNNRVITRQGMDVTQAFTIGAEHTLSLCQRHGIRFALLKKSSPSCGSQTVYDGSFSGRQVSGQGVTSKLLNAHGIEVFSEYNISLLQLKINHLEEQKTKYALD